jgi:hypothetical protein
VGIGKSVTGMPNSLPFAERNALIPGMCMIFFTSALPISSSEGKREAETEAE